MAKSYYKPSRYRTSSSQSQTLWIFLVSIALIFGFLHYSKKTTLLSVPPIETQESFIPTAKPLEKQLMENTQMYTPRYDLN